MSSQKAAAKSLALYYLYVALGFVYGLTSIQMQSMSVSQTRDHLAPASLATSRTHTHARTQRSAQLDNRNNSGDSSWIEQETVGAKIRDNELRWV